MNVHSFIWATDLNGDGAYSPWEIVEAVKWAFRLPGNLLLEGLGNVPYVSSVLHIQASEATGYSSLNSGLAASLSLLIWAIAIFTVLSRSSSSDTAAERPPASKPALIGTNPATIRQIAGPDKTAGQTARRPVHLPVSRANYAMPGKAPLRHKRQRRLVIT
ncbi:hypothetical protein LKR43_01650 [Pusillimonas sp. MFBS29]|uniref:hypothetical protein n=1 Tax=Pusillimonas sp. MFBS29 TaxID=2886690 RepID=UPI001D10E5CF|nr:hypothetical protein [Pusillimonas sp. MFBS29]MCC2595037.1 hypothetical protein [Pusillimonas sp. MFBS29]